jgi:hypothetical protein
MEDVGVAAVEPSGREITGLASVLDCELQLGQLPRSKSQP